MTLDDTLKSKTQPAGSFILMIMQNTCFTCIRQHPHLIPFDDLSQVKDMQVRSSRPPPPSLLS